MLFTCHPVNSAILTYLLAAPVEAPCPICQKVVPTTTINAHIDSNCKKYLTSDVEVKQKQKDGWGKVFGNAEAGSNKSKGKARYEHSYPQLCETTEVDSLL